jgi:hypothetical protein
MEDLKEEDVKSIANVICENIKSLEDAIAISKLFNINEED